MTTHFQNLNARLTRSAAKHAARVYGALVIFASVAMIANASAQFSPELQAVMSKDMRGAADSPLTGRYQGSALMAQTTKAFDELILPSGPASGKPYASDKKFSASLTAQGKVTRSIYMAPSGRSSLEVANNYFEAVAANGFEPVYRCAGEECGESFVTLKYRWDNPKSKVLAGQYRINPARLVSRGLGPLSPVATNRTDEGRAKNRRVEIVEQ